MSSYLSVQCCIVCIYTPCLVVGPRIKPDGNLAYMYTCIQQLPSCSGKSLVIVRLQPWCYTISATLAFKPCKSIRSITLEDQQLVIFTSFSIYTQRKKLPNLGSKSWFPSRLIPSNHQAIRYLPKREGTTSPFPRLGLVAPSLLGEYLIA